MNYRILSTDGKKRVCALILCSVLTAQTCFATGRPASANSHDADSTPCDLSPVVFPGGDFSQAVSYLIGGDKVLNPDLVLSNVVFSFGPPRSAPGFEHKVVDMTVQMDFNAQGVVKKWSDQVNSQADVGCSSRTVWFPNPAWQIEQGAWVGRFHVKEVVRACFWFFGNVQLDKATYEMDFWNRVGVKVEPGGKNILPDYSNGSSDNVPGLVKFISQGLGAIAQIVSLGFVPQADVQAIDGHRDTESALLLMSQIEASELSPTPAAGPQVKNGVKLDFLFTGGGFRQDGGVPILSITSSQNQKLLPNRGEACTMKEFLVQMQTGGKNVGPKGTDYTVVGGDSLWGIAKKSYGDGHYHLLVAAANNIPLTKMNQLRTNQKLRLEPVSAYRSRGDIFFVTRGDNLWKLAASQKSGVALLPSLIQQNSASLPDPNIIYPIQVLHVPPAQKK
jgi:hypothetical protein